MAKLNVIFSAFNRGIISKLGLSRVDVKRTALSAETMTNWMPRVLGSMMLRPGTQYISSTKDNDYAVHFPFIFATDDTALLELTDSDLRVRVNETVISRVSVSSAVANGTFNTDLTSWSDDDEAGAVSSWQTGGYMGLLGTGFNSAIRSQQVTVSGGDANKEHALRIIINRGPVTLRVGTTNGSDNYISQTTLGTGTHSLAFTPTGNFYIQFSNVTSRITLVDSVAVEAAGDMVLPTPWVLANLGLIRYDQSGDVIFCACYGLQQRRIERRGTRSWSIVLYQPEDGPFMVINTTNTTLTPSALSGNITLASSKPLFRSTHVGALYKIDSIGQQVSFTASGDNQFSDPIKITGLSANSGRVFSIVIIGTFSATLTLQRSISAPGAWTDVTTFTSATSTTYNDGLDNQIIYYRIGIKTGNYVSGSATMSLTYSSGSITGIVRITAFTSSTSVSAEVLTDLGSTSASDNWYEGSWSDFRGWPSAVTLYEGRLWWAGKAYVWGSVSDAFASFASTVEGDSGPISRVIGSGPVDKINWMLPLQRLILGTQGAEKSCRSSSFDEPLTPTNFNIKDASTQGSRDVAATIIDTRGIFVQRSGIRIFEMVYNNAAEYTPFDYTSNEISSIVPEIGEPGIVRLGVQRQPDTRVHAVRSDGKVAIYISSKTEEVSCWVLFETDGIVEDVVVLPGDEEDKVYYCVARTIGGVTKRYLERWALESECQGGTLNKQADSFILYSGVSTNVITGLSHLEGKTVVVWANGTDRGTYTVASASITVTGAAFTSAVVGLYYEAPWKSTKLAYGADMGTAINMRKRIDHLGIVTRNMHAQGLKYGRSFDDGALQPLPRVEMGKVIPIDYIWTDYDKDTFEFPGEWDTDSRLCLLAAAPRPVTLLSCVIGMFTHDKG